MARKEEVDTNKIKKLILLSKGAKDLVEWNSLHPQRPLNILSAGVPLLERTNKDYAIHHNFALLQVLIEEEKQGIDIPYNCILRDYLRVD